MNPRGSSMCKNPRLLLPGGFETWPARDQRLYTMRARWLSKARPEQLPPEGDWRTWLLMSGRGFGKTRLAAEDVGYYGMKYGGSRIAIVAATFADIRDTCVEGESGLLSVLPADEIEFWNRSMGELRLKNGTLYRGFSADQPDRLRGPQFHRAWCDELAAWARMEDTWTQVQLSTRLKPDPRIIVTTTPRPLPLIKALNKDPTVKVTTGSTFDNAANLAASALAVLRAKYEGTRLGRQELAGEIVDVTEGALWNPSMLEPYRKQLEELPLLRRIVVGIDPAVSTGNYSAETGIVVAARGVDGRAYVLEDASLSASPDTWAQAAVNAYRHWNADRVIGEVNNGGDLVESTIRTVDPNISFTSVRASRGKIVRAEPVAALYEQGKVSHIGQFAKLEDQMCTFIDDPHQDSPDRLDALVWALTELMLGGGVIPIVGPVGVAGPNYWRGHDGATAE